MSWEQIVGKTQEELDASAQAKRDEVIANYITTLDGIEQNIVQAKDELANIRQDIGGIHAKRLQEYAERENELKIRQDGLNSRSQFLDDRSNEIEKRNISLNKAIADEIKRSTASNVSLTALSDQLHAFAADLKQQKVVQDRVALEHQEINKAHTQRRNELDMSTQDVNKVIADTIAGRKALEDDQNKHKVDVLKHEAQVKQFLADEQKNMAFYTALLEREKALEPMKEQNEKKSAINEAEAVRLRDENIRAYNLSVEVEKKIELSQAAERKAADEINRLESLKQHLATKIKEN